MLADRVCFDLGLPFLLRELEFDFGENLPLDLPFLNGALNKDKFKLVKRLSMPSIYPGSTVYEELLRRVAPSLEHLSIGVHRVDICGSSVWKALEGLRNLKSLEIHTCSGSYHLGPKYDFGASFHAGLFKIVEKIGSLEIFALLDSVSKFRVRIFNRYRSWPDAPKDVPEIATKLTKATGVFCNDLGKWAQLDLRRLCEVHMEDWNTEMWKKYDPFPNVRKLVVCGFDRTQELLT
jgi:hypothetical protein